MLSPTAKPKETASPPPYHTIKLRAIGNLGSTELFRSLNLSGKLRNSEEPPPVDLQFFDLFGKERHILITFNRVQSSELSYFVQAFRAPTEPDPEVEVLMGSTNNAIHFTSNGSYSPPLPSGFSLKITRSLTEEEFAVGLRAPSYTMQIPVSAWGISQSNDAPPNSFSAKITEVWNGIAAFKAVVPDSLGNVHRIRFYATHSSSDCWQISLPQAEYVIPKAEYKVGEQFFPDLNMYERLRENFLAEVRFDPHTGKVIGGVNPTYRIFFDEASPSIISLDLSDLTSLAGYTKVSTEVSSVENAGGTPH